MVKARPGETLDSMLRRFKKDVAKAGVLQDLKKHEYYVAPSEKRRLKSEQARKRAKKNSK
jgi:small subunit ribosomal protein S21